MLALFALVGVCGAVILTKLYHRIKDMQNASLLGSVVPYGRRHKAIPRHGQRVQLSPCEVALVKASMEFRGATRITVVALMSGPEIAEPLAREALARLSAAHPFLRSKVLEVNVGGSPMLVAEVDDGLRIPYSAHHIPNCNLEQAWRAVYDAQEKEPLRVGACLARLDVITAGVPVGRPAPGEEPPTVCVMLSCEHAVCDGVSLSVIAQELFGHFAAVAAKTPETPVAQYWAPALETACSPGGIIAGVRWIYRVARFFSFPQPKGAATFPVTDPSMLPRVMSQRCVTRRQYGDLSTSATAQLLLSCHARHTTVTGALSAAAALALAKVIDKSPLTNRDRVNGAIVGIIGRKVTVCLSYFADMRHHFWPPISPNCLCYNVSLMPPFKGTVDLSDPKSSEASSLWAMSVKVRRLIERGFHAEYMNLIGSAMGIVLDMAFNSKEIGTKTTVTCALSNAGLIPANEGFGPWKLIRVRPVVNMAYARYPTLLIETAAGHLTVTILSPSEYISDGDAEALMSEMMSALQTLIGGGTIQQDEDNMVTTLNL